MLLLLLLLLQAAGSSMTVGPSMLCHPISVDILLDKPEENAVICSWMYMRNVSDYQHPILRMVSQSMWLRCIAIAPPACNECKLMDVSRNPFATKPVVLTPSFTAFVMLVDLRTHASPLLVKCVLTMLSLVPFG
jgi:hypothetical protein